MGATETALGTWGRWSPLSVENSKASIRVRKLVYLLSPFISNSKYQHWENTIP